MTPPAAKPPTSQALELSYQIGVEHARRGAHDTTFVASMIQKLLGEAVFEFKVEIERLKGELQIADAEFAALLADNEETIDEMTLAALTLSWPDDDYEALQAARAGIRDQEYAWRRNEMRAALDVLRRKALG
jgi:hypothetical protein